MGFIHSSDHAGVIISECFVQRGVNSLDLPRNWPVNWVYPATTIPITTTPKTPSPPNCAASLIYQELIHLDWTRHLRPLDDKVIFGGQLEEHPVRSLSCLKPPAYALSCFLDLTVHFYATRGGDPAHNVLG